MFWKKPKKTPPTPASTYPKEPEHFSVKKPEAVICCFSCRKALWVQEVRTTNGMIVSHRTIPCGDNSCAFSETDPACPLCTRPYYKVDGKKKKLLVRSTKTGKEFVI